VPSNRRTRYFLGPIATLLSSVILAGCAKGLTTRANPNPLSANAPAKTVTATRTQPVSGTAAQTENPIPPEVTSVTRSNAKPQPETPPGKPGFGWPVPDIEDKPMDTMMLTTRLEEIRMTILAYCITHASSDEDGTFKRIAEDFSKPVHVDTIRGIDFDPKNVPLNNDYWIQVKTSHSFEVSRRRQMFLTSIEIVLEEDHFVVTRVVSGQGFI